MASQKSPAFQFYAKDFLTGTATMSLAERGAYVSLLAHEWHAGSVPDSAKERARILGCSNAEERKIWSRLVSKFSYENGSFINARLEEERHKQAEFRRRLSDRGKAGADARWQHDECLSNGPSIQQASPKQCETDGSSVFSLQSSVLDPSKNDGSRGGASSTPSRPKTLIGRNESVNWDRRHGRHVAGFCDWVCLDEEQTREFAAKIPGDDTTLKETQIREWATAVRQQWADRIIPDGSHFDFWRNRWTETHGGSRPANATLKAKQAERAIDEAFR